MVILSDPTGIELRRLNYKKIDMDLNNDRTFEMTIVADDYSNELAYGNWVYIPNTEYGGIIGEKTSETAEGDIKIEGFTWRNVLEKKIIEPPAGQAYKTVSGELNSVIADLVAEAGLGSIFVVSNESSGVSVSNYQFDRYATLRAGIVKMLKSVDCKLQIRAIQQDGGLPTYIELSAQPIVDQSNTIELSQDCQLNFTFHEKRNGINHLICLGKGEGVDRTVLHLYVQQNGTVGTTQYYTGVDERAETYDFSNAEADELEEKGIEKLQELMDMQEFNMNVEALDIDVDIGDIVGGRDYVTGMYMAKPVENKIYTEEDGVISKDYELEGDDGAEA